MLSTPFPALYSLLSALAYTEFLFPWLEKKKMNNTIQQTNRDPLKSNSVTCAVTSSNEELRVY